MICSQHPALDPLGSYKCLLFTPLSTNFSGNIFCWGSWPSCFEGPGSYDLMMTRELQARNFTAWAEKKHCLFGIWFGLVFSCIFTAAQLSWVLKKYLISVFFLHIFLPDGPQSWSRWISGSVFVSYKTANAGVSYSSSSPLVYPLLCSRFLPSNTSVSRLLLLPQLLFCIGNLKRKQFSLVLSASCKTHKCMMFTQERNINLCSNFYPVDQQVGPANLKASVSSLCTFSMENVASLHNPALTCNLRPCSRNPASSVCPCLLCQFYSHQIY